MLFCVLISCDEPTFLKKLKALLNIGTRARLVPEEDRDADIGDDGLDACGLVVDPEEPMDEE